MLQRYMYFPVEKNAEGRIYQTIDMSTVIKAISSDKEIILETDKSVYYCQYRGIITTMLIYNKVVKLMNKWSNVNK